MPISQKLVELEWWHNKCYRLTCASPDGSITQTTKHGDREIPYGREFFRATNARFSLVGSQVAYFSNDLSVNCCEVIEQFRLTDNLSWEDLHSYLRGRTCPDPELFWYPLSVHLKPGSMVLDLTNQSIAISERFSKAGNWSSRIEFEESVLLNRDPTVYPLTQKISRAARANGFDAICYRSVRTPVDIRLPDQNLVVFQRSAIIRAMGEPDRVGAC